jgi:nitrite reductase/ring-hydroxylating ferredoxin subunit
MTEADRANALVRNPELVVASTYEREIEASLERVWENVYDWEHLPWVHSEAFESIEKLDSGEWGWHARIGMPGAAMAEIELVTDQDARHYVARTLEGAGAPSEIWTTLDPIAPERTGIRVEFCVRPMPEEVLRKLGSGYISLYTLLWSQDEGMMQARERALAERHSRSTSDPVEDGSVSLGRLEDVRKRLPLEVDFRGRQFRVVDLDRELVAHSTECPHLLGPLNGCNPTDGVLVCPWHGYRFDLRSGKSADGRSLRLRSAPRISIDEATGEVHLYDVRHAP